MSKEENLYSDPISSAQAFHKSKKRKVVKCDKFTPPDPRCHQCYYWRTASGYREIVLSCCHCLLETGVRRIKISDTECGSFIDKESKPKRKYGFDDVPMAQWGCGGFNGGWKWEF